MAFLKFIFITLLVVWFVGLILRATLSRWLRKRTEEFNRAAKQAEREARRARRGKREGEVTIETTETVVQKKVRRDVGDYVEFEEVTEVDVEDNLKI